MKIRHVLPYSLSAVALLFAQPIPTAAIEAHPFRVVAEDEQPIDLVRDHYCVEFLGGWVSSKDKSLQAVLAKKTQLVESMSTSVKYFDGPPQEYFAHVGEQKDLKKGTARRWGGHKILVDNLPADVRAELGLKLLVHREERLAPVLEGLTKATPPATALEPWLGYTTAVTSVLSQLSDAGVTSVPFEWSGPIKVSEVIDGEAMHAHYLFLVAPRDDRDRVELDGTKLSYEDGWLLYDGERITENSWAVLRIYRSPAPAINRLRLESQKPWAIVANRVFSTSMTELHDARELMARVEGLIDLLDTEQSLLKQEHRFSAYDRAVALRSQALFLEGRVQSVCALRDIEEWECPAEGLGVYANALATSFGLAEDRLADVDLDATMVTGEALAAAGQYQEAEGYFLQVIAARPEDYRAFNALAGALYKRGERETAIEMFERVRALSADQAPERTEGRIRVEDLSDHDVVFMGEFAETVEDVDVSPADEASTEDLSGEAAAEAQEGSWKLEEAMAEGEEQPEPPPS